MAATGTSLPEAVLEKIHGDIAAQASGALDDSGAHYMVAVVNNKGGSWMRLLLFRNIGTGWRIVKRSMKWGWHWQQAGHWSVAIESQTVRLSVQGSDGCCIARGKDEFGTTYTFDKTFKFAKRGNRFPLIGFESHTLGVTDIDAGHTAGQTDGKLIAYREGKSVDLLSHRTRTGGCPGRLAPKQGHALFHRG